MADTLPPGDASESITAGVIVRITGTTTTVRWAVSKIRVWLRRYKHPHSIGREKPKSMQLQLDDVPSLLGRDIEPATLDVRVVIAGPTDDVELVGRRFYTWLHTLPGTADRPQLGTALSAEIAQVTREKMKSS